MESEKWQTGEKREHIILEHKKVTKFEKLH